MRDKIFEEEKNKLDETVGLVKQFKKTIEDSLEKLGGANLTELSSLRADSESGMDLLISMQKLHEQNEAFNLPDKYKRIEEFKALQEEPYFSRLDLFDPKTQREDVIYIGKFGLSEVSRTLITDWRAKVASVYYRYRFPQKNVEYLTPNGKEVRDLNLKRTFEIDSGELIKYYNNDIQLEENQIIVDKIEQRTGGVLEDIVETIQEAQLDIIEADPRQVCIVQGCVGSGKSTVAIHKLSHIFFNYPNLIRPERSILIAKNQILVSYLSTLFPKLGIFDINYKTLKDLIIRVSYTENMHVKFDFDSESQLNSFGLKALDELQSEIAQSHSETEEKIIALFKEGEFEYFGGYVYNSKQAMTENIKEILDDLKEEIDLQKESIENLHPTSIHVDRHRENIKVLQKIIRRLSKIQADLKEKEFHHKLRTLKIDITKELNYKEALLYLYIFKEYFGFNKFRKYEYCVVDEGQDFGLLEYLVLGTLVINGRFCILGDLNQSYQEEGLSKWEEITHVVKDAGNAVKFELDTNYRSTKPIIDLANKILGPYTDEYLPKSINRIGDEPVFISTNSQEEMLAKFKEEVTKDIASLDKSVGIVCFDKSIIDLAEEVLMEANLDKEHFIKLDSKKEIHYLPKGMYLTHFNECKGLEFSKVIALGLDLEAVSNFSEAKKAFVTVTRAMNELTVLNC